MHYFSVLLQIGLQIQVFLIIYFINKFLMLSHKMDSSTVNHDHL